MPTELEIQNSWRNAVKILQETLKFGIVNNPSFHSLQKQLIADEKSDFATEVLSAISIQRGFLSNTISNSMAYTVLLPHLKAYCKYIIKIDTNDVNFMLYEIYNFFLNTSRNVQSRNLTYGNPTSGNMVGNGRLLRVTKDAYNFDIENTHATTKTFYCISSSQQGALLNEEIFRIKDTDSGLDAIDSIDLDAGQDRGCGYLGVISNISCRNSLIQNPSFAFFNGTPSAPTSLIGWNTNFTIAGDGSDIQIDQTKFYRSFIDDNPSSLVIKLISGKIFQKLYDPTWNNNIILDPFIPYIYQCAVSTNDSWNGNITLAMGNCTKNFNVNLTSGNWAVLTLIPDEQYWYYPKNWVDNGGDTEISISWNKTSGNGDLYIDDVLFSTFTQFDNLWYAIVPYGYPVIPFKINDTFICEDSGDGAYSSPGLIQAWFHRAFNYYLPHTKGSATFPDA